MKTLTNLVGIALLATLMVTFSCKKVKKDEAYFKAVGEYITAYTGGSIGRNDPIRIVLSRTAITYEQANQAVARGICTVSPDIDGTWVWENDHTLLLQPKTPLTPGKKYTCTLALGKLFSTVPKTAQTFEFSFDIRMPVVQLEVQGVQAESYDDLKKQQIKGYINTNEPTDHKQLETVLTAYQNGKSLPISWRHEDGNYLHHYIINGVARANAPGEVELQWNTKAIGGEQTGTQKVTIPSLGDFFLLNAKVQQNETQSILLNFSDPLLPGQDLSGLIRIEGYNGAIRAVIEGNFVTVFPEVVLEGTMNLVAEPGIKNIANARMVNQSSYSVDFDSFKPRVRLVGRGSILPGEANGDVLLPFEAVGLKAIDIEVFKVFQSNILQFLQTNDIAGSSELERVGRIVMHKKVSLSELNSNSNTRVWQRYALNLRDLIAQDPGAIYQVRIGFRRGYAELPCATAEANDDLAHLQQTDEYGNLRSIMGDYRGIYTFEGYDYDYEEESENENRYNWSDRNNPCEKEYYCSEHFASRNVFVSNLGLMAKTGKDKSLFVVATNLKTAAPASGVTLDIYDYQLQKILEVSTDRNGTASVLNMPARPYIVAARNGDDRGYVRLFDGSSLSLSNFDVAGVEPQKGMKGYLYGERGVWRPGDSLYLNFVLEGQAQGLPANHPLSFELLDPSGKLQFRTVTTASVGGVYPLHCATPATAPTGSWQAKVMVGGATFVEPIRIEAVKPNRLKINLDFGREAFYASDKTVSGNLQVNWLHGAPGKNLKTKVEMQVRATGTSFNNFRDFVFDDPTRQLNAEPEVVFEGSTNENGTVKVPLNLNANQMAPGKLTTSFKVRAFEPGGDFSTDNFGIDYYPYDNYIGVSVPKDQWGGSTIAFEKGADVRFIVLDRKGNPVANRTINIGLYRLSWQWWWDHDNGVDRSLGQYNSTTHVGAMQQVSLKTDSKGQVTYAVKPNEWGRYLIRAIDPIGGHSTGTFFWSGYPDDLNDLKSRNAAAMLPFSADKGKYMVGDVVTLHIPASDQGRILVTLEDGEHVIDHFWNEAKAGSNQVTFRTTNDMAPNVYAHVSLFQPHAQTKNDLPIRMYGVTPIIVEDQGKHLEPKLAMPDALKPGKPFTVEVSEAKGRECTYTLAIVDDGLLDLTRFQTPDAFAAFHKREALGVTTYDVYDQVLGAYATSVDRIMSVGGDAFNTRAKSGAQVSRFKPAILHIGPFRLNKGQKASHTLKLDNYVGSVRAMLVCSDAGKAYGSTDKTVAVKQPLMIMPTLPRVLGPGETLKLPVEVFAMESHIKSAGVSVKEGSGMVQVLGGAKQLSFAKPGQQMTSFDIKAGNKTGKAVFTIQATGSGESSAQDIEIEVRNPNPIVTNVLAGTVEPGQTWTSSIQAGQYTDIENAMIELSAVPPLNLASHLDYLIRYPHGCVEQVTSGAFPQLFVDLLMPLGDMRKAAVQKHITAAIQKLQGFQGNTGGFAYWPGEPTANDWNSSYVGHFLLEAKAKGYTVPDQTLNSWKNYQTTAARQWSASHNEMNYQENTLCQAYRLYTLAMHGSPSLPDMNRLLERNDLAPNSAAMLASAYALVGKHEVGKKVLDKFAAGAKQKYEWWGYTYGSPLRDDGLLLEAYTLLNDQRAGALASSLMRIGDGNWYATSELATAIRALSKYAEKQAGSTGLNASYSINGGAKKSLKTTRFVAGDDLEAAQNISQMAVTNSSPGKLYIRITYNGRPVAETEKAVASNMDMKVRYTNAKGEEIAPEQIRQGTDFFAEVQVKRTGTLNGRLNDMALTHVFPSGWEILSSRITAVQSAGGNGPVRYRDIRDDRVLTYFDLPWRNQKDETTYTWRVQLNAAYPGRYYMPSVACEAMYDNRIRAVVPGKWVEVI